MYRLGVIYAEKHKGKEKTAIKWLKRAVKAGHREARGMLATLEKVETGEGKVSGN
jgi:TPR repeat protein